MAVKEPRRLTRRSELVALAKAFGVRDDWHEPDEQEVTVSMRGRTFDNAGFWPAPDKTYEEMHVVIFRDGKPMASVNLATLFAWATGLED